MNTETKLANFAGYLAQNDRALFEIFKDDGSLGLYPDAINPQEYKLMIVLAEHYYTQEQADKLFTLWRTYKALPLAS